MRWATFHTPAGERAGALAAEDTLLALPPGETLLEHLRRGTLDDAARLIASGTGEAFALAQVTLRAPLPRPPSLRDSLCYLEHLRQVGRAVRGTGELSAAWYETPAFYFAAPASVVGPHDDVAIAPGSERFDFELEIAAVIGGQGRADLGVAEASDVVAGYTIYCDWSARDLQAVDRALGIGQAKGKDAATTLGPFLVTPRRARGATRRRPATPGGHGLRQRPGDRQRLHRQRGLASPRNHLLRLPRNPTGTWRRHCLRHHPELHSGRAPHRRRVSRLARGGRRGHP